MNILRNLSGFFLISLMFLVGSTTVFAGYGYTPSEHVSDGKAPAAKPPECNNSVPGKASISAIEKSGSDKVKVSWGRVDRATSWTLSYGIESGKYIYGLADFGNSESREVEVNMLPAGLYFFAVKANNGCRPGEFSGEWKIRVGAGGTSLSRVLGARTKLAVTPTPSVAEVTVAVTPALERVDFEVVEKPDTRNVFQKIWDWIRNLI